MLNVAKNGIILYLKQMGMIKEAPKRTIANTRTKLLSKNALTCEFVIEMVVQNADMRKILIDIYVKRIDDSTIMSRLGMNEEQYNKIKDKAIAILKSGIIRSPYNFEDMLGDKEHKVVTVTTEYATQFAEWCEYKAEENPLIDIFGTNLSDEEIAEKVDELLHSMYEKMDWNESERYLWRKRYFEDASPNDLAEELGIRRSNVDVRYSRLKAKFYSALREWWKENSK
ncbi:MAG: hypothetical protein LKF31_02975 [Muribaculaceae bacterium]|nr:hypothetical protein [Muribaculaceae bacterium]